MLRGSFVCRLTIVSLYSSIFISLCGFCCVTFQIFRAFCVTQVNIFHPCYASKHITRASEAET